MLSEKDLHVMPEEGLEPSRPKAADFKSAASTDSATPASHAPTTDGL